MALYNLSSVITYRDAVEQIGNTRDWYGEQEKRMPSETGKERARFIHEKLSRALRAMELEMEFFGPEAFISEDRFELLFTTAIVSGDLTAHKANSERKKAAGGKP